MSPQEHQLSQEVLEFLIAQQDWFMLDIPPESERPASPLVDDSDYLIVVRSSDDEHSQQDGGWKVLDRERERGPAQIDRRRTTSEYVRAGADEALARTGTGTGTGIGEDATQGAGAGPEVMSLDPVEETAVLEGGAGATVTRSRTLPSERTSKVLDPAAAAPGVGGAAAAAASAGTESDTEQRRRAKVLKKHKRTSMQGPRRPSAQSGNSSYGSDSQQRSAS